MKKFETKTTRAIEWCSGDRDICPHRDIYRDILGLPQGHCNSGWCYSARECGASIKMVSIGSTWNETGADEILKNCSDLLADMRRRRFKIINGGE